MPIISSCILSKLFGTALNVAVSFDTVGEIKSGSLNITY